uniref:DUF5983 family protein n=1 Tax=Klebsiella pneumoniae TaxID=573 RepID=UPI001D0E51CC|nr:hypothetical protein [Klebsiella pneumoniae]
MITRSEYLSENGPQDVGRQPRRGEVIEKNRYGWILRISATEQWRVELTRAGISASALDNIAALNGAGFDWIWFDRDAEQVPELTVWEW